VSPSISLNGDSDTYNARINRICGGCHPVTIEIIPLNIKAPIRKKSESGLDMFKNIVILYI